MLLIEDSCQPDPSSFLCIRLIIIDILAACIFMLALQTRVRGATDDNCCLAILLSISVFLYDNDMGLMFTSYFLQILTFSLLTFSFVKLYYAVLENYIREKRILLILLGYQFLMFIVYVWGVYYIETSDCPTFFNPFWLIYSISIIVISIICHLYGWSLIRNVHYIEKKVSQLPLKKSSAMDNQSQLFKEVGYLRDQRIQLQIVVSAFLITSLFIVFWDILAKFDWVSEQIECNNEGDFISNSDLQNSYLFVRSLMQLIPCILLSYIFYLRPILMQENMIGNIMEINFESADEEPSDEGGTEDLSKSKRTHLNLNSNLNNSDQVSAFSGTSPLLKSSNQVNSEYKFTDLGYTEYMRNYHTTIIRNDIKSKGNTFV